jgi:hypothetical protein
MTRAEYTAMCNARAKMWEELIPGLRNMSKSGKKEKKRVYAELRGVKPGMIIGGSIEGPFQAPSTSEVILEQWRTCEIDILEDCPRPRAKALPVECPLTCFTKKNKKKGKTMYDYEDTPEFAPLDARQKGYLSSRLYEIVEKKESDLRRTFGLKDDEMPRTLADLLERFASGKFTFPENKKDQKFYYAGDIIQYVRWRDPSKKEDQAGFDAAQDRMYAARQLVDDAIQLKSTDEAYAALKDFESKDFATA